MADRPIPPLSLMARLIERLRLTISGIREPVRPHEPEPQPEPRGPDDLARERIARQLDTIRRALEGEKDGVRVARVDGGEPGEGDGPTFLYRPGHALVREDRFGELERFFISNDTRFDGTFGRAGETTRSGLTVVTMPSREDGQDPVLATLAEIDRELEVDPEHPLATPDHVLHVTYQGRYCPATEPEPTRRTEPLPARNHDESVGRGIQVAVVDTGICMETVSHKTTSWMEHVAPDTQADIEVVDQHDLHAYAGHGSFVSGVIKCIAPGADVEVQGALPYGGADYESEICKQLEEALEDEDNPKLISISAGTYTRENMALLSFDMLRGFYGLDADGEETVIIAAAGNESTNEKFYPAAFDWVVGVGAVGGDGKVADYSNYGKDWVDVYARGTDLVNAFPTGTYTCKEPENIHQSVPEVRQFRNGLAEWSGTSFSTPIVTGLVAARMATTGETARQAVASVLSVQPGPTDPAGTKVKVVGPLT